MDNICLYRHLKPCGEVFYIGIGNPKRPFERKNRNSIWNKTINKYPNYEVQILKSNLSWEDACKLEIMLIDFYGKKHNNTGTLCNITNGGEGFYGVKHSDESKLKMSNSAKGRIVSLETRNKLSLIRKGIIQNESWLKNRSNALKGRKLTDEHKLKLKNIKNGINLSNEDLIILKQKQSNINNKEVINIITKEIFNSITDAAKSINMKRTTLNAKLIGKNKNNTNFLYLKDYKND
jgi:hypothetical protein